MIKVTIDIPKWHHLATTVADGVVEVRLHSDDASLTWNADAERELTELFAWLSTGSWAKVLLLTASGPDWCVGIDPAGFRAVPWRQIWKTGRRLLFGLLDLEMLVVAAVQGPAHIHSELAMMADIVIAAPEASFADKAHFVRHVVPGDGVQLVWANLIGPSRASYYLLTGNALSADEALRLGVVHEIHPREELLSRARTLAASLAERPQAVIEYTRSALRMRERRGFREDLSHGLALEGEAQHAIGLRSQE